MDLKRHSAREEAAQWLAKLDRGLRQGEGVLLRKWLKHSVNRTSILSDAQLSETRVIGDFRTGDIDECLDSLRRNYRIASQRDGAGKIVLSRLTPPVSRL